VLKEQTKFPSKAALGVQSSSVRALAALMKCEPPAKVPGRGIASLIYLRSIIYLLKVFKNAGKGKITAGRTRVSAQI